MSIRKAGLQRVLSKFEGYISASVEAGKAISESFNCVLIYIHLLWEDLFSSWTLLLVNLTTLWKPPLRHIGKTTFSIHSYIKYTLSWIKTFLLLSVNCSFFVKNSPAILLKFEESDYLIIRQKASIAGRFNEEWSRIKKCFNKFLYTKLFSLYIHIHTHTHTHEYNIGLLQERDLDLYC